MKKNTKVLAAGLLAGLVGFALTVRAEDQDLGTMPYLHPRACGNILDTRGFEVYWSKNCDVVYIAPPVQEVAKHTPVLLGGVQLCEAYDNTASSLNSLSRLILKKQLLAEKELAHKHIEKSDELVNEAVKMQEHFDKVFATFANTAVTPGAAVQSQFRNDVTGDDVYALREQNMTTMLNLATHGQMIPDVQILSIGSSIFSFNIVRPEDKLAENLPTVLEIVIPGLQPLIQPDSTLPVAHVKADGGVSAKSKLSLSGTCNWVEKVGKDWVKKPNVGPESIVVNRSYQVPMKAGYSMTASLQTDIVNKVVETLVADSTNHNLTKTQIYNKTLELNGVDAYVGEVDTDLPLSNDEKFTIQDEARKALMDRYFEFYEKKGTLTSMRPISVVAPEGANINVTYWARRCWSSWFGASRGCRDYAYQVPEWNNGHGYNENVDQDIIDTVFSQKTTIFDVVNTSRSTYFTSETAKVEVNNEKK